MGPYDETQDPMMAMSGGGMGSGLDPAVLPMGPGDGLGGNSLPDMGGDPGLGEEVNMGGPVPPPPPMAPEVGGDMGMGMGPGAGMDMGALDPNMMGSEIGGDSPMDLGPMPPAALPPNPPNQGFQQASVGGEPGGGYGAPPAGGGGMGQGGRMSPLTDADMMKMKSMFGGGGGF